MSAGWLLGMAIVAEVIATTALKASEGFARVCPAVVVVAGSAVAFCYLSLVVKSIPLGLAQAVWSGLGIVPSPCWPEHCMASASTPQA